MKAHPLSPLVVHINYLENYNLSLFCYLLIAFFGLDGKLRFNLLGKCLTHGNIIATIS